ncbi:hypothetical protein PRNP1_000335 [Phytophthora ramorum]
MDSHSRSSSFSGGHACSERLPVPATMRLQRAMEAHAALQARTSHHLAEPSRPHPDVNPIGTENISAGLDLPTTLASTSVDDLATQLRSLWRREQGEYQESRNSSDGEGPLPTLKTALEKIGSREKDDLLIHLLGQEEALRTQRSEVAALGEKIAAQLLHQQHELRQTYREQITQLEEQLHDALHYNPKVATLQTKVEELEGSNREREQKLRFAVQKLQRSRKREKELKMMNDPLWD